MIRRAVLAFALVVALAPGVRAGSATVDVANFSFTPATVNVLAGDTVTWHWVGGFHSVIEDGTGAEWCATRSTGDCPRTFPDAGTFAYHCSIHASMHGSVVVDDPGAPDLLVSSLAVSEDGSRITAVVHNAGANLAPDSFLRLTYRSTLFAERRITEGQMGGLAGGSSRSIEVFWNTTGKLGDFTITATVDSAGQVSELDETNNAREAPASVLVAGIPGIALIP